MRAFFITSETSGFGFKASDYIKQICEKADTDNIDISKYSDSITSVCIVVNCFDDSMLAAGFGKPRKYICYKKGSADIRLPMPYVKFKDSDERTRYLMVLKNIIDSIEVIGQRCRKSKRAVFDSELFIKDFLEKLETDPKELEGIQGVIE